MIRAFLALEVTQEIVDRYASFHTRESSRRRELRWVRPENLHVTMRFLGDTTEDRLEPLRLELARAMSTVRPFHVSLGEPGCFGPRHSPQVLWFALDQGADALVSLAATVENAVQRAGFPPEKKPWRAHLTVARNPKRSRADDWKSLLDGAGLSGLSFEARAVTLFSSQLGARGPTYTSLWQVGLTEVRRIQ